jgi:hypothetical protein
MLDNSITDRPGFRRRAGEVVTSDETAKPISAHIHSNFDVTRLCGPSLIAENGLFPIAAQMDGTVFRATSRTEFPHDRQRPSQTAPARRHHVGDLRTGRKFSARRRQGDAGPYHRQSRRHL